MEKLFKNSVWLAPMAGITDKAFRIIAKKFEPAISFTEMVSCEGLFFNNKKTEEYLEISNQEGMVGIQIFGHNPTVMQKITYEKLNGKAKFININMGCPAPKIVKNKDGCYLMKEPKLAEEIVKAVVKVSDVPVSVKIRNGWNENLTNAVEFSKILEESGSTAIIVHGRTREQFFKGQVDLGIIKKIKENVKIPIIGNGDIIDEESAENFIKKTKCDAIMIGRASRGNPWIFREINYYLKYKKKLKKPTLTEKLNISLEHAKFLLKYKGEKRGIREFRKHLFWYLKGIKLNNSLKEKINKMKVIYEVEEILFNISNGINNLENINFYF
ncbi:MAG: tRNA dihydrouridine synthase DusB [Clostridiales bacterium]|nr:tRNA dihydrouridine synthase DusB [Clostridiales bacterium]